MLDIHLSGVPLRRAATQFLAQSQVVSSFSWHGCSDNCMHTSWITWQKQGQFLWIGRPLASPRVPVPGQGPPFQSFTQGRVLFFLPLFPVSRISPFGISFITPPPVLPILLRSVFCFALLLQSHGYCKPLEQPPIIGVYSYPQTL